MVEREMKTQRRHDIDWLRTLASYLVVIYHTAQFFDYQQKAYIKNGELSWAMDIFTQFVHLWHMPLFFLLAGWSCKPSLSSRGPLRFLGERAHRLLIPLMFGLFVWCAPPRWVELKHGLFKTTSGKRLPAQPNISFTIFLQEYYYTEGGISWGHLWFLAYLFTFTALYLPGFWVLSRLTFLEKWFHGWGGQVLANAPVIPLAVIQITLRDRWPGYQNLTDDWANFWFYSTFFVTGFCLSQHPVLEAHLHASWKANLILGSLSSILCLLPSLSFGFYQSSSFSKHLCSALGAWYMVLFLLSSARKACPGRAPPSFWTSHAFPVYILHDVPLSLLADALLESSGAPILVKFASLAGLTLLVTLCFSPTRIPLLRFLIGMKKEGNGVRSSKRVD